jgi:hypothetical protein
MDENPYKAPTEKRRSPASRLPKSHQLWMAIVWLLAMAFMGLGFYLWFVLPLAESI